MKSPNQESKSQCSLATKSPCGGFTVFELLVVIAVVAVLAALLMTVVEKMRTTAGRASAVSGMKSLGSTIFLYANDHDGWLPPGPDSWGCWLSMGVMDSEIMLKPLAPYIGASPDPKRPVPVKAFVSENHLRLYPGLKNKEGRGICVYALCRGIPLEGGGSAPVFGYYGLGWSGRPVVPLRLQQVQTAPNMTPIQKKWRWLLQEADQSGGCSAPWDAPLFPKTPVHGNVRHRLYTDGHVEGLSLEESDNLYKP
jgi:prepilin-type N-terminal cleavage/methylation domain-containing protein